MIEQQDPLTTQFGTLKVVAGNISVHSRNAMGLDADVDIDLDSNTGERISVIGHLVESNCTTGQATSCTY